MFVDKSRRFVWKRNANKPRGEDLSRAMIGFLPGGGKFDLTLKKARNDDSSAQPSWNCFYRNGMIIIDDDCELSIPRDTTERGSLMGVVTASDDNDSNDSVSVASLNVRLLAVMGIVSQSYLDDWNRARFRNH